MRVIRKKNRTFAVRFGERLRIPVDQSVNSGVFGRTWWFVNRWFKKPVRGAVPTGGAS